MCVFRPLSFKSTFTTTRTHIVILSCVVVAAFVSLPPMFTVKFTEVGVHGYMYSRVVVVYGQEYQSLSEVRAITTEICTTFGTQLIVTICLVVLTRSLRDASRVRAGMTSASISPASNSASLAGKELQAVKQVALVATIFVICNTPQVIIALVRLFFSGFSTGSQYHFTYMSCIWIRVAFETLNSSANFFVYFNFNSNFRAILTSKSQ